jgi:hypothetical protein
VFSRYSNQISGELGKTCSADGGDDMYKILKRKTEGKRQLRRSQCEVGGSYENISWGNRFRGCGLDSSCSGYGLVVDCCEGVNELWVP